MHRKQQATRRAKKVTQDTGLVTLKFIKFLYNENICFYCKKDIPKEKRTMDHKIPISKNGLHDPSNLVMSCGSCNSSKGNLTDKEFISKRKKNDSI